MIVNVSVEEDSYLKCPPPPQYDFALPPPIDCSDAGDFQNIDIVLPPPPMFSDSLVREEGDKELISIGTSLVGGLGSALTALGTKAINYVYRGADIPRITNNIKNIISDEQRDQQIDFYIQCGGNDCDSELPTSAIINNYADMIDTIYSHCPNANIICGKIPDRLGKGLFNRKIGRVNLYLKTRSYFRKDIHFLEGCPEPSRENYRGAVHFNKKGTSTLAENIHNFVSTFHTICSNVVN